MKRRIISLLLCFVLLVLSVPPTVFAAGDDASACYIATTECPAAYVAYATENISKFVSSLDGDLNYSSICVGTPFAFADISADVYYFPVVCDGHITYLFRVYPDGASFSAAITAFLADEIENLAKYTSADNPMYLNLVNTKIVATIGSRSYTLFEYPENMSVSNTDAARTSVITYSVVDAKETSDIPVNLRQTRDVYEYINLDLTEYQTNESWCTAFCLAAIYRTQTNYDTNARDVMTRAIGNNPSIREAFPWPADFGITMRLVSRQFGLSPTVKITTVSNAVLIAEINAGRPCLVAMDRGAGQHSVVLRGYSSLGTWGIWNPWFEFYESYSISGSYVPTGYPASSFSYTPYMHAYNFG